jgi:hypothetical protein
MADAGETKRWATLKLVAEANELRARDAEARLRRVESELRLIETQQNFGLDQEIPSAELQAEKLNLDSQRQETTLTASTLQKSTSRKSIWKWPRGSRKKK